MLLGWLADRTLGDPRRGHPVAGFGALAQRLERALWRDRRWAGAVYAGVLGAGPALAAWTVERRLAAGGRAALLTGVTWAALGSRSLGREAAVLARAVAAGDLDGARRALPSLCGRDPWALDGGQLCRAAAESVAENTADAVVGPLLWGTLAGAPGVVAHRCVNTLDAMVGYRSAPYARFGWAAARLDDVMNWLPARATAALAAACAPVVGGSAGQSLRTWRRDGARHPSPNAGRCEAAFAGALGVRLGGEHCYRGRVQRRGPFGDGPAPGPADVHRAVRLSSAVGAVAAALTALRWTAGRVGSGHGSGA